MYLDFSPHGWKDALKEFALSVFKTAIAAAIGYILTQLAQINVPVDAKHASEIIAALGLIRALLTSLATWITTVMPVTTSPVVDANQPVG